MGRVVAIGSGVFVVASVLVGCGTPADDALRDDVLSCIVSRGGTLGDGADVAISGGKAVAVVGPVEASEAVISGCLDLANR